MWADFGCATSHLEHSRPELGWGERAVIKKNKIGLVLAADYNKCSTFWRVFKPTPAPWVRTLIGQWPVRGSAPQEGMM